MCWYSPQNTIDLQIMLCEISASNEAERAACGRDVKSAASTQEKASLEQVASEAEQADFGGNAEQTPEPAAASAST